ncbi:MAG: glycosyltransferase [Candidatus Dadabacteria bacterium]|nr:glycosyltransferase [Candidatus Dadabacteria bacterium]NIQ13197.1 glycosyltransferase [Candidatus Dadabacteria bacterium]
MRKVVVIIPVLNEETSIGLVLNDVPKEIVDEIVVVDNGSHDRTKEVALKHGATVVEEKKKGYGHACLRGIDYASKINPIPDIIVFLDGDYSDYPQEMVNLVKPIFRGDADLVIGSRTLGNNEKGAILPQAIVGNYIATSLIKFLYKVRFTDLGPFRAIKYNRLIELDMQDKTYGWTVEMQVKAAKRNFKCIEVPVSYRKRIGVSKITGTFTGTIKAGYKIIWTIFKYL